MSRISTKALSGVMELLPSEQVIFNKMLSIIKETYESFGFSPLDLPILERGDILLAKAGGDTEKQIYLFERGGKTLGLRFDLTVPLARYVAEHMNELTFPFMRYQIGKVYRGERAQAGRYREFYQCDIDIIGRGKLEIFYDALIMAVMASIFAKFNKQFGIGGFKIRINNRKILEGVIGILGFGDKYSEVLHAIDKIDKIGKQAVIEMIVELGYEREEATRLINILLMVENQQSLQDNEQDRQGSKENNKEYNIVTSKTSNNEAYQTITYLEELIKKSAKQAKPNTAYYLEKLKQGVAELKELVKYLNDLGVQSSVYKVDLVIVRGLDYYTGTVYETFLEKFPDVGSVCSGGRYDNLAGKFTKESLPGVGMSIGLTRLFSILQKENALQFNESTLARVAVVPVNIDFFELAIQVAKKIRDKGIPTIIKYPKKLDKDLKWADKLGVSYVAIIGEEYTKEGKIVLKDMKRNKQKALAIKDSVEVLIG